MHPTPATRKFSAVLVGGPHCGLEVDAIVVIAAGSGSKTYPPIEFEHNDQQHAYQPTFNPARRDPATGRLVAEYVPYAWKAIR